MQHVAPFEQALTLSLPRVINFKFPLQLHQKYYITQIKNLAFHSLLRWHVIPLNDPHYLTHTFLFGKVGRMYFLNRQWPKQEYQVQRTPSQNAKCAELWICLGEGRGVVGVRENGRDGSIPRTSICADSHWRTKHSPLQHTSLQTAP